jgi:hypothetical protein
MFPCLATLDIEATVEFYDNFQKTSVIYLLPIMPFNCISIKMGFEALCSPGLGLPRYACIARVRMELLPRLLLRTDTQVTLLVNMVCMESGIGYELLWCILGLSVPGFNPSIPVKIPYWHDKNIFDFALAFILYYRLQAKKGITQDDCTCSKTFLNAIHGPPYADAITMLLLCINNYLSTHDDGYLPANLYHMGLATQINLNACAPAHAVVPKVHCTIGLSDIQGQHVPIQGSPRVV